MILSFSLNISIITFDTAVADISTACPWLSSTAAKPMISGIVIFAWAPTPAMRCVKFARYGAEAVQFCDNSLITEPTASRAFSVPSRCSSPKMFVNFERVSVAPSPRSSKATLIWSAAFTNPNTSSCEVLPNRPASCANLFNSSRPVLVSIFWNSSFKSSTSEAFIPVNLRTFAISWSISAKALTAERPARMMPVIAAAMPASAVCQSLSFRFMRSHKLSFSRSCELMLAISAFTRLIAWHCLFHSSEPRSKPLRFRFSCTSTLFSSFGDASSSRCRACSTPCAALSICDICLLVSFSSRFSFVSCCLFPAFAAFSIAFSRLEACALSFTSISSACFPFTVSVTVALVLIDDIRLSFLRVNLSAKISTLK